MDVDIGGRWVLVHGKAARTAVSRWDGDLVAVLHTYLLSERPVTTSAALFLVAKGPHPR